MCKLNFSPPSVEGEEHAPRAEGTLVQTRATHIDHFQWIDIIYISPSFKELLLTSSPGGSVVQNLPFDAGDMGSIPDLGRSHMQQSD